MAAPKADDRELWRRAMRDVAPLPGRSSAPDMPVGSRRATSPLPTPAPHAGEGSSRSERVGVQPPLDRHAGVDRATAERLRRGRYPVEAVLDLHGFTEEQAHRALTGFVVAARVAAQRCLLVVTGHGRTSGGILRHAVPRWLDEAPLRQHVLLIAPAKPQHGGHGAFYLLLRRPPR